MFEIKKIRHVLPCKEGDRLVAVLDLCMPKLELNSDELSSKRKRCAEAALQHFNLFYEKIYGLFSSLASELGRTEASSRQPTRISADFEYGICDGIVSVSRQTRIRKAGETVKMYDESDEFDLNYACFIRRKRTDDYTRVKNVLKSVNNYIQYKGISS